MRDVLFRVSHRGRSPMHIRGSRPSIDVADGRTLRRNDRRDVAKANGSSRRRFYVAEADEEVVYAYGYTPHAVVPFPEAVREYRDAVILLPKDLRGRRYQVADTSGHYLWFPPGSRLVKIVYASGKRKRMYAVAVGRSDLLTHTASYDRGRLYLEPMKVPTTQLRATLDTLLEE